MILSDLSGATTEAGTLEAKLKAGGAATDGHREPHCLEEGLGSPSLIPRKRNGK
jgi:hypothetical protein